MMRSHIVRPLNSSSVVTKRWLNKAYSIPSHPVVMPFMSTSNQYNISILQPSFLSDFFLYLPYLPYLWFCALLYSLPFLSCTA